MTGLITPHLFSLIPNPKTLSRDLIFQVYSNIAFPVFPDYLVEIGNDPPSILRPPSLLYLFP
jgi:hypothetical protein